MPLKDLGIYVRIGTGNAKIFGKIPRSISIEYLTIRNLGLGLEHFVQKIDISLHLTEVFYIIIILFSRQCQRCNNSIFNLKSNHEI
jgi:hypothetical protein